MDNKILTIKEGYEEAIKRFDDQRKSFSSNPWKINLEGITHEFFLAGYFFRAYGNRFPDGSLSVKEFEIENKNKSEDADIST